MTKTPYGPGPLVYAHRGDSAHAKDNSIDAFGRAVDAGADGIELDVRRTADGHLILAHDPTHPDIGPLADASLGKIQSIDDSIPTLRQGLAAIPSSLFVNVEVKNHRLEPGFDALRLIVDQTVDEIVAHDDPTRILMSSFDPFSTRRARKILPELAVGQLVTGRTLVGAALRWAQRFGYQTVNVARSHIDESPETLVVEAARRGLLVAVWTVDDPEEIDRLFRAGVAAVITNDPAIGRQVADRLRLSE